MRPTPARALLMSAAAAVVPAAASAAISDINSIVIDERIFNDFPSSTLNITDNDFTEIEFDESGFFPDGAPDFGPAELNARAGATAVGAREFLIAYNVNLNTRNDKKAKALREAAS